MTERNWIGAALAFTFFLSAIYWNAYALEFLSLGNPGRLAWPGFEWYPLPDRSAGFFQGWLIAKGAIALLSCALFLGRRERPARWLLWLCLLLKLSFLLLDRRLMGNYHYMPMLASLCFLLFPGRLRVLQLLVVSFYMAAGFLKLNPEWLSGSAIPPGWLSPGLRNFLYSAHPALLRAGTHWVVLLELLCAPLLFHPSRAVRYAVLLQLGIFHLLSYPAVGYFYPVVMAFLLLVFPVAWAKGGEAEAPRRREWIFLALFWLAQALPWQEGGRAAISRELGLFALNMFDTNPTCVASTVVRSGNAVTELALPGAFLAPRIRCEPALYYRHALELCADFPPPATIDLHFQSRRSTDMSFTVLVDERDLCRDPKPIFSWRRNAWIRR